MSICLFCGKGIRIQLSFSLIFSFKKLREPIVCETCFLQFNPIDLSEACLGCSRPQHEKTLCWDCQKWQQEEPQLTLNHTALFTYNERAKEYMKEFKFQGDLILAELFTEELYATLKNYQRTHYIVPIPTSQESMKSRGFSQVHLLLEKSGIDYKDWLIHIGSDERQSTKNRANRLLSEQFLAVNLEADELSQLDKPLLIVDDVYTTGRTILHAKNAFHNANEAIEMKSFSLFR